MGRFVWLVVIAGCPAPSTKDQSVDTADPPPGSPAEGMAQGSVDVTACARVPTARPDAQVTAFVAATPFVVNDDEWTIDRGILLYGGSAGLYAPPSNELWLLDLTNPDRACPWILISDAARAEGGTYGGGLAYRPSAVTGGPGEFVLVTGYEDAGGDRVTPAPAVYRMREDELALGFVRVAGLGGVGVDFVRSDDGICGAHDEPVFYCPCDADDGCTYWDLGIAIDPCGARTFVAPSGECATVTDLDPACPDGPYCAGELGVHHTGLSTFGAADGAVVYDPVQDTLEVHGGALGCQGTGCATTLDALFDAANVDVVDPDL
ncbi:MAG: hypothetical protein ABMB14_27200, partial [Myxococcota bacterium]